MVERPIEELLLGIRIGNKYDVYGSVEGSLFLPSAL